MQFLLTEILYSFRLVLEEKTGKEIPEPSTGVEFFILLDVEDNTSGSLNIGVIADLSVLRTLSAICQKSRQPIFWEVMDSFVSLACANFGSIKSPFATITSLSGLYSRFKGRFILLLQTKKMISMSKAIYLTLTEQIKDIRTV